MKVMGWTATAFLALSGFVWDFGLHNAGGCLAFTGACIGICAIVRAEP